MRSNFRSPIIGVSGAWFDRYDPEWSRMTSEAGSSRVKPFSPDIKSGWLIIFTGSGFIAEVMRTRGFTRPVASGGAKFLPGPR